MNRFDIVIIGAGISGLSLAHFCFKRGLRVLVLEKSKRIGGCLHSERFDDFWIELGAHTCYNSYTKLIGIMEECNAIDLMIPRENVPFKMLVGDKVKSIPSQLNILELVFSIPKIFFVKKNESSVGSYYKRIVGKNNYETVVGPAISAVLSQDADDFPAEFLFKRRKRRKDILKKYTFKNGLETIAQSIGSEGISIITGINVSKINFDGNKFSVVCDSDTFGSDFLALSIPPPEAAGILKDSFPSVSEKLSFIKTKSVNTTGVVVKRDLVSHISPFAGIIPVKDDFYSIVSRDTVRHEIFRGFVFHFKPTVGHNERIKKITDILKIDTRQIEHLVEKVNVVPSLMVGHLSLVRSIDDMLSKKRLLLTGNYFEGMAIEDCIIRSYKEYNRLVSL